LRVCSSFSVLRVGTGAHAFEGARQAPTGPLAEWLARVHRIQPP
jgi:hypothetical protein